MTIITRTHELKPASEAPGTFENVNDVQTDFTDISAGLNGNLDADNLAVTSQPATVLGWWRPVQQASGHFLGNGAGLYGLTTGSGQGQPAESGLTHTSAAWYLFSFDPADYTVVGLTPKCRIRLAYARNSNPAQNSPTFTAGFHAVTASGGQADTVVLTLNSTPVVGVSPPQGTALHSSAETSVSSEVNLPTAGVYAFGVNLAFAQLVNEFMIVSVRLEVRHV